jgi:aryl-alcohol dehydrogenase-like predicted oxidoreductase
MEYRNLGVDGPRVSAIGFGCWEMGNPGYGSTDDSEAIAAIHRAIDLGITLFDTAPNYGAGGSEALLGRALGSKRNDIVLVSKTGISRDPVSGTTKFDSRISTIKGITEDSLKRLGTDHLDVLLVHWPDADTPIEEAMRAIEDLRAEGKTRYVGVSNYSAYELGVAKGFAPLIANQVGYNMFDRRWERQMFPKARELGVGIMAYGPMAHGLLSGAFSHGMTFDEKDWRRAGLIFGQRLFGKNLEQNLDVVDRVKAVASDLQTTLPRLALAWVLGNPAVSVALSGCRKPSEIEENVSALEVKLTPDVRAELDRIMESAAGQVDTLPGRHHFPPEES